MSKVKKILKYILRFIKYYIGYTFIMFFLNENMPADAILKDALVFTCVFEFIEYISDLIKKKREKNGTSPEAEDPSDTVAAWISGISFVLLLVLRFLSSL